MSVYGRQELRSHVQRVSIRIMNKTAASPARRGGHSFSKKLKLVLCHICRKRSVSAPCLQRLLIYVIVFDGIPDRHLVGANRTTTNQRRQHARKKENAKTEIRTITRTRPDPEAHAPPRTLLKCAPAESWPHRMGPGQICSATDSQGRVWRINFPSYASKSEASQAEQSSGTTRRKKA